jgi:acetylornithine/succinyldiaminopimelate/putrescine aminotransferase
MTPHPSIGKAEQMQPLAKAGSVLQRAGADRARVTSLPHNDDEDSLLHWVGSHVRQTRLRARFEGIAFDPQLLARAAIHVTHNLRTSQGPILWASGNYFVDIKGVIYLDFCAQTQNLNFGHNHPHLIAAAMQFLASGMPCYTSSKFGNLPCMQLTHELHRHLPRELNRINLKLLNGADAVETAFKSALQYHARNGRERRKIVSLRWAHHGQTAMTMASSNKYAHLPYISCDNNTYIDANDLLQLRQQVSAAAGAAALILEPVQMNGGAIQLTAGFVNEARRICSREDVVLIFDEIQTAFGWTGKLFGLEHYGVVPDILCLSKALASGFPLSAAIMREQYDTLEFGEAEYTGGLNPLSATIALANLELLTTTNVMQGVAALARRLSDGLSHLLERYPSCCKEARGLGLMQALETPSYRVAKAVYDFALAAGVLLRISKNGQGETILLKPSLLVTPAQIDKVLGVMHDAFASLG